MNPRRTDVIVLILGAIVISSCSQKPPPGPSTTTQTTHQKQEGLDRAPAKQEIVAKPDETADEQLMMLRALVLELEADMIKKQKQWQSLENANAEDPPIPADLARKVENDPTVFHLQKQLECSEATLRTLEDKFGKDHRIVREAQEKHDRAASHVAAARAEKLQYFQAKEKERVRRSFYEANDQFLRVKERLQEAEYKSRKPKRARLDREGKKSPKPSEEINEPLLTLRALATELEVDLIGKESMWKSVKDVKPEDMPMTPDLVKLIENDPVVFRLQQQMQEADEEVVEAQAKRDRAAERIAEMRASKLLRYQAEQKEAARRNFSEAQDQLRRVKERIAEAEQEQRKGFQR